jgi:HSP20 family protein
MLINPFSLLRRIQNEASQAFSPGRQSGMARRTGGDLQTQGDDFSTAIWVPPVEVAMQDNNFVLSAELPGVPDEDVTVQITDDAIVLQGERQAEREEDRGTIRRTERVYGQFYRVIPLPDGADPDQARAEFNNGVLRVTVPISQAKTNAREIPIQTSGTSAEASGSKAGTGTGTQTGKSSRSDTSGEKAA